MLEEFNELKNSVKETLDRQAELKTSVRECKESMANRELVITFDGAGQGRNAEERKNNLRKALDTDEIYQSYKDDLRNLMYDLDSADADVKTITVTASILTAAANLQAAMINAGLITDDSAGINGLI